MKLEPEKQFNSDFQSVASLLRNYSLELKTYAAATSGIENTTLIASSDAGKCVVRIYRLGKKSKNEITVELDFMEHLLSGGVKVPRILHNTQGTSITEFEQRGAKWQAIVMDYIAGQHADIYTTKLLIGMAQTQARMHVLSSDYVAPADAAAEDDTLREQFFLPQIDVRTITDGSLRSFLQRATDYCVPLDTSLPRGLCHLDYDKDNIIANNDAIAAVLDFDDLAMAPFVVCLGYTLWHVRRYGSKKMAELYIEEYEKIRQLSSLEKSYICKVMLFRHYMISDLKILNGHTNEQEVADYIALETELLA